VRLVLNPIWNAYNFFTLYANADGYRAQVRTDSTDVLDRYILAKTHDLVGSVTASLDAYDLAGACAEVRTFLDALNNWYIRRSRDRFWAPTDSAGDEAAAQAKRDAYDTLYTVLTTLTQVAAPLLPMLTEEIYTGLTGEESVHLSDWPALDALPADPDLVRDMDRIRDITTGALSLREDHGLRTRLPLARLTVAGHDTARLEPFVGLLRDEVNVKEVAFSDDLEAFGSFVLKPNPKVLGPKLGGDVQKVMGAARSGDWTANDDGTVVVAGHTLEGEEFDLALVSRDGEATAAVRGNDTLVNLDVEITPELAAEGTARDLVRALNDLRKATGLSVSDRIAVTIDPDPALADAVTTHAATIAGEVLATTFAVAPPAPDATVHTLDIEGHGARVTIAPA
jgi:isoleucyl-tRNA synthetase